MQINKLNTHIMPQRFEYHAPTSLEAAVELLSIHGGEATLMAGGTDLLVKMKQRLVEPSHIINIKNIEELTRLERDGEGVHIGSATRLRNIERSELIATYLPLLHESVRSIGSVQIRNMATIGGNLCNASPAADCAVALLALDAEARILGPEGARTVSIEEFFIGPGKTVLRKDEVLVEVLAPPLSDDAGTSFIKVGRTSLDLAMVNIAVVLRKRGETVADCRIALGAVAPTPVRVHRAEEFMRGKEMTRETLEEAANIVSDDIRPITDVRAPVEYRREVSKTLTRDALAIAWRRIGGDTD